MKKIKIISIFTAICIIFCFYGCHKKSENAVAVDKMIANLGKIEINDAEQIDQIDKAISKLTEEEKNELDKKKKFDQAKAKINELKKQERISDVENSINKIGEVTLNSEEAIENAENAYNSLTDNEKKSVSNISTLTNARKTFERLYSENKKEKIQNAKQYFSNFSKEKDEFQDVVWYYHKNMPEYIDIRSYVIPFFYIEDDNVKIQIRYNYTGDDWIFFKQVTILADGKKYNKTFDYFNITHNNEAGSVWEYISEEADEYDIEMLRAIAKSKTAKVRYEGDDYIHDITINNNDKKIIKDVLKIYDAYN